ncbi:MAG: hypothetical protein PHI31_03625 [Desulfuromonadaceae bacterium]|nr:hypothetical protein [Desulfuromonadaceae bacterium]
MNVDDQQAWDLGRIHISNLLSDCPAEVRLKLMPLLTRYREIKEELSGIVAEVDSASVCRECQGQCCLNGKYRINVLDAITYITSAVQTAANFSQKPLCPYGGEAGCAMEPGLRPADCVLFICDRLDLMLMPRARAKIASEEQNLRKCIDEASRLTGEKVGTPLLLWAESKALI